MNDSKKDYKVDHRVLMDDEQYEVGDTITLSHKDAKPLLETNPPVISLPGKEEETPAGNSTNVVSLTKEPEELAERISAIKVEIEKLDENDKTKWTNSGVPDANVLTEMLGWKVKAKERDWAWKQINKETKGQN